MHPLFSVGKYDIVESDRPGELQLTDCGRLACDISGQCADRLRILLQDMRSPDYAAWVANEVNCHGLAEYIMGRNLKWRRKPKYLGSESVPADGRLPAELPLAYQLMSVPGKAAHSGVVLGRHEGDSTVFVLDKLHSGALDIDTYRKSVQRWTTMICPLNAVRLRYPQQKTARKAA